MERINLIYRSESLIMTDEDYPPDPPLTAEQRAKVAALSRAQIQAIDDALLSNVSSQWRKVARVVGTTMMTLKDRIVGIPDIYYAERLRGFVNKGLIEAEGDFTRMGRCEVRLPGKSE